ncbi:hypothetical protein WMY93_008556 [Mugilogobius chulae]|uniref:CUB domain-containing protein n=1 Tax=Mugilogobius chulae TaxID=88201 RepID=A0AAW0PGA5_9GOBI
MFCPTAQILFALSCLSSAVAVDVQYVDLKLDGETTLTFRSSPSTGSNCKVCEKKLFSKCVSVKEFKNLESVSVKLKCDQRRGAFDVDISRTVECTSTYCTGDININNDFNALQQFNRFFVWKIKATNQIKPSESCPDNHTYTYEFEENSEHVQVGKFCKTGPISEVQAPGSSTFKLALPAGQTLQNVNFDVSVGETIETFAKMSVSLKQGPPSSSLVLLSPNPFPDDKSMEWNFEVPAKHQTSIQLLDVTKPQCLEKKLGLKYNGIGTLIDLTEKQPVQLKTRFNVTLTNCKMDKRRPNAPGLSVSLNVSTSKTTGRNRTEYSVTVRLKCCIGFLQGKKDQAGTVSCDKCQLLIEIPGYFTSSLSNHVSLRTFFSKLTLNYCTIIAGTAAALLVVLIVILVVVCLVIGKKKKKNIYPPTSIYNPNGTSFLPVQNVVPQSPETMIRICTKPLMRV